MGAHPRAGPTYGQRAENDGPCVAALPRAVGPHDGCDDAPVRGAGRRALDPFDRRRFDRPRASRAREPVISGYLLAWATCGAVAFAALVGSERLLTASPTGAKWLGVAIFVAAGIYQFTPAKDFCLSRCRSPIGALMYYFGFKGTSRDVRVGLHHGATCIGCCWA